MPGTYKYRELILSYLQNLFLTCPCTTLCLLHEYLYKTMKPSKKEASHIIYSMSNSGLGKYAIFRAKGHYQQTWVGQHFQRPTALVNLDSSSNYYQVGYVFA